MDPVARKGDTVIKTPIDKSVWIQGALAALFIVILLFLVLAPSSRADASQSRSGVSPAGLATTETHHTHYLKLQWEK